MSEGRGHGRCQIIVGIDMPGRATECLCDPGKIRGRVPDAHAGALLALLFDVDERQRRVIENNDDNAVA